MKAQRDVAVAIYFSLLLLSLSLSFLSFYASLFLFYVALFDENMSNVEGSAAKKKSAPSLPPSARKVHCNSPKVAFEILKQIVLERRIDFQELFCVFFFMKKRKKKRK